MLLTLSLIVGEFTVILEVKHVQYNIMVGSSKGKFAMLQVGQ